MSFKINDLNIQHYNKIIDNLLEKAKVKTLCLNVNEIFYCYISNYHEYCIRYEFINYDDDEYHIDFPYLFVQNKRIVEKYITDLSGEEIKIIIKHLYNISKLKLFL